MTRTKYYDMSALDEQECEWNFVFGERSNGKTTAILERILKNWIDKGEQGIYVRRQEEEIKTNTGGTSYQSISSERGLVSEWSKGEWDSVVFYRGAFWLGKYDEETNKTVRQNEPFCVLVALSTSINFKSASYPKVTTICYDEFITFGRELKGEMSLLLNLVSTVARSRDNLKIWLLGNTVNFYSKYFDNFGLTRVPQMRPGMIDVYKMPYIDAETNKKATMKIGVEYTKSGVKGKASDKYFAFDNSTASMIKKGGWDLPYYAEIPFELYNNDILDYFFVHLRDKIIRCDIALKDDALFIACRFLRDSEKIDESDELYKLHYSVSIKTPRYNYQTSIIGNKRNKLTIKISDMIQSNLIYFDSIDVGVLFTNYINMSSEIDATNVRSRLEEHNLK